MVLDFCKSLNPAIFHAVCYSRLIAARIAEALADTPVVLVAGPRQAGKTTLVQQMATQGMRYLTLDDGLTLLSAGADPVGMVRSLDRAIIDEIQRAPQLRLAIKKSIDEDGRPGRFLLAGSVKHSLSAYRTTRQLHSGLHALMLVASIAVARMLAKQALLNWGLGMIQRTVGMFDYL
jgi:hypothetical protein